jgi:hypothetical protein
VEYNAPSQITLDGELDVDALTHALGALVARHEVLRTRLVADADGEPRQVIDPPAPFALPVVDLSAEPDPGLAVRAWLADDAAVPFDLATGPLFRATLVRVAADEHVLAIAKHHVVSDDWSTGILQRELDVLYAARRDGVTPDLVVGVCSATGVGVCGGGVGCVAGWWCVSAVGSGLSGGSFGGDACRWWGVGGGRCW